MFYQRCIRPFFFRFDPEDVHHVVLKTLECPLLSSILSTGARIPTPHLEKKLFGLSFPNPIGLAAGFDKDAQALPAWESLGFGSMEIGTITRHPQPGNPRPRIFRIPSHQAVINRMGFPNEGADAIARRLTKLRDSGRWPTIPVGINIGKSKVTPLEEAPQDYLDSFNLLREFAGYIAINVSSPNTPGLRSLQTKEALTAILTPLMEANSRGKRVPVLVKIAPDLSWEEIDSVVETIRLLQCDGIIATNTTLNKDSVPLKEEGGLSGQPIRQRSTEIIRHLSKITGGNFPIIGVGGIQTASDALEKLESGASLLQVYTSFIYEGPRTVRNILSGL